MTAAGPHAAPPSGDTVVPPPPASPATAVGPGDGPAGRGATSPDPTVAGSRPAVMARNLPGWMGSIRFRLTVVYSCVLFGLAAVVVGLIYLGLSHSLSAQPVSEEMPAILFQPVPGGAVISQAQPISPQEFERITNERTLATLRQYSLGALFVLFLASLGVGWVVAGMVLRPVERITDVARDIQATDLSRRIRLPGPDDELKVLADTFDDMLSRIDMAFEEQRQFIHEASHELRNPLAVIRTNVEVALSDPGATEDDLRQALVVVDRSSERMARLVDDLLVYARKGTTSHQMGPVDVGQLVHEAVEEFRAPADANGLRLEGAAGPELVVQGDRYALKQALANLLANAVRLAPAGSGVRVAAGREATWVWLAVEDQGPGIAPEDQERVFQRFFRGDGTAARAEGRSGLGLTIVRQIAEAHGGEVKLVSAPGRGSAFAIWLPAA